MDGRYGPGYDASHRECFKFLESRGHFSPGTGLKLRIRYSLPLSVSPIPDIYIHWKPSRDLTTLRDEMDILWDQFFGEWPSMEPFRTEWVPSLDVSETKDNIVLKAEAPGMDTKDIDISLVGDVLTIKGEKKQEKEEKDENYHRIERSYGSFSRSIRLPQEVQSDKIKANFKNGVLKITLPKSEEAKAKEVKIKID